MCKASATMNQLALKKKTRGAKVKNFWILRGQVDEFHNKLVPTSQIDNALVGRPITCFLHKSYCSWKDIKSLLVLFIAVKEKQYSIWKKHNCCWSVWLPQLVVVMFVSRREGFAHKRSKLSNIEHWHHLGLVYGISSCNLLFICQWRSPSARPGRLRYVCGILVLCTRLVVLSVLKCSLSKIQMGDLIWNKFPSLFCCLWWTSTALVLLQSNLCRVAVLMKFNSCLTWKSRNWWDCVDWNSSNQKQRFRLGAWKNISFLCFFEGQLQENWEKIACSLSFSSFLATF